MRLIKKQTSAGEYQYFANDQQISFAQWKSIADNHYSKQKQRVVSESFLETTPKLNINKMHGSSGSSGAQPRKDPFTHLTKKIREIIKKYNFDRMGHNGRFLVHKAAQRLDLDTLEFLIELNIQFMFSETSPSGILDGQRDDSYIIEENFINVDLNSPDDYNNTPLFFALNSFNILLERYDEDKGKDHFQRLIDTVSFFLKHIDIVDIEPTLQTKIIKMFKVKEDKEGQEGQEGKE